MSTPDEQGNVAAKMSNPVAEKFQRERGLTDATPNQFLTQAPFEEVQTVIYPIQEIRYTREEAAMLIKLLDAPAAANTALTKAFARYRSKLENGALRNDD